MIDYKTIFITSMYILLNKRISMKFLTQTGTFMKNIPCDNYLDKFDNDNILNILKEDIRHIILRQILQFGIKFAFIVVREAIKGILNTVLRIIISTKLLLFTLSRHESKLLMIWSVEFKHFIYFQRNNCQPSVKMYMRS